MRRPIIGSVRAVSSRPMATSKRDRQRANREAKLAAEKKVMRKQNLFQRSKRIVVWVVVGVVLLVIANLIWGGSDDTSAAGLIMLVG
jgi:hypothetical protein